MQDVQLTPQERRLRVLMSVLAAVFGVATFAYLLPALVGPNTPAFVHLPFVTNSAVKVSVLALLSFLAAADVRRFRIMTVLVITGHVISELAVFAALIWGDTSTIIPMVNPFTAAPIPTRVSTALWGSVILDGVILGLLFWFHIAAEKARYHLDYLSPLQFRSLEALSEALVVGKDEVVPPAEIARNVDRYLGQFRTRTKWIFNAVLIAMHFYPLLSFKPPLPLMDPHQRRRFLEQRFYRKLGLVLKPLRNLVRVMIRIAKQMAYLGYYNDPRTFASVGYVPFSARPDTPRKKEHSPPEHRPLTVQTPKQVTSNTLEGDVVIIGSGAGGAVLAHAMAAQGREVLMLERGDYVEPKDMNEDEADMLSKLYADGALQLTRDFQFQVLQGSCVGGTTVINNAVSFDLPDAVLAQWNDPQGLNAGLDAGQLQASFAQVRALLHIQPQAHEHLNKGARPFEAGIEKLTLGQAPNVFDVVDANIQDCYGCGYCNIGCQFGKKLSMLDTVLPAIQAQYGPEALRIVSGCRAEKLQRNGSTITAVECTLADGRRLEVRGKTIVVAAGAVSSSILLLRSKVGNKRVGKQLAFNIGSPVTGVFKERLNAYEGLQISHYLLQTPSRGYVLETWYNPPVAQALTMPGWFEDHYANMLRYDHLSSVGVLTPSASNAVVRNTGLLGRDIKYKPTGDDLGHVVEGLIMAGKILFAGGAASVMPHTWDYHEFADASALEQLRDIVRKPGDITLGTGHPQGGNRLSKDEDRGVVNPEFQVFGYDNLYICDASVFPSSIGVNPQLTVMALAQYAGQCIR